MALLEPYLEAALAVWDGLPGSGKSFKASEKQIEWLLSGNPVITNLHIKSIPAIRLTKPGEYFQLEDTDFDQDTESGRLKLLDRLQEVKNKYPDSHPLLVIDECHDIFNARKWKDNDKGGFFSWIAQHRHMGISVLLITQDYSMLDKALRCRAQEFRSHENLVKDAKLGLWLWMFGHNVHRAVSYPNVEGKPNKKKPHDWKVFKIRKHKARRYSSGQMHKLGLADTFRGRSDVPRKLSVFLMLCCLLGGAGYMAQSLAVDPEDKPKPNPYIEAPPLEGVLESCFVNSKGTVVCIVDGNEFITTSTQFWDFVSSVGQTVSIPRHGGIRRHWAEDIIDQVKKTSETQNLAVLEGKK